MSNLDNITISSSLLINSDYTTTSSLINSDYTTTSSLINSDYVGNDISFVGYNDTQSDVSFEIEGEVYNMKSIILLLKVLMKKEGLSEDLLTMDYGKLEILMGRELEIDELLNTDES